MARLACVAAVLALTGRVSAEDAVWKLQWLGTFDAPAEAFDTDRAEHLAYDPVTQRLIVAGAEAGILSVLSIVDPTTPTLDGFIPSIQDAIDNEQMPFDTIQSVAVANGVAVGAMVAVPETDNGIMSVWDLEDFKYLGSIPAGPQPEGIATYIDPTGFALVACVNEGSTDYDDDGNPIDGIDPPGSITMMRLTGFGANVNIENLGTIQFDASVGNTASLLAKGVRLTGANANNPPLDLEPERAVFHPDGTKLFVNLQDNSGVGVLDVATLTWDFVDGYGFQPQMYDASNEDGKINIQDWGTFGVNMPDGVDVAVIGGKTYLFTADEGSGRDYEESRFADIGSTCANNDELLPDEALGRLTVLTTFPTQLAADGSIVCGTIHSFGGRSFSIFEVNSDSVDLVFNSMQSEETDIETVTTKTNPTWFNSQDDEPEFDDRSDDKGAEPEAIRVGQVGNTWLAFVGLERMGGIFVYDVTDPTNVKFQDYLNRRHFGNLATEGPYLDIGPEDIVFIPPETSPICAPMISVANAISGSVTNYKIIQGPPRDGDGHVEEPGSFGEFATPPLLSDVTECDTELVHRLQWVGTYESGLYSQDAAENLAIDPTNGRYVVVASAEANVLQYVSLEEPTNPTLLDERDVLENLDLIGDGDFKGTSVQSVVATRGVVCAAVTGVNDDDDGRIIIYDGTNFGPLASVVTGPKPEGMSVSADGFYVASANEGSTFEDENGNIVDPPGSVTVVKLSGEGNSIAVEDSFTLGFEMFTAQEVLDAGLRLMPPNANNPGLDLEPEATAFTPDGKYLIVNFQDNNGLAVMDLEMKQWVTIAGYGYKVMTMDPSDEADEIEISDFSQFGVTVFGMYQPDSIDAGILPDGSYFVVTANEGDARDDEDVRLEDLETDCPSNDQIVDEDILGRLEVTTLFPAEFNSDGTLKCETIYAFGGRSFSVFKVNIGQNSVELLYDSDDLIEQLTAETNPNFFNSNDDANELKSRSDAKGPEPEILKLATLLDGTSVLFVGLERVGGVLLFNMDDPTNPVFQDYINRRNFGDVNIEDQESGTPSFTGQSLDSSPEGIVFVPASKSAICADMIVVANAVTGTTTLYRIILGSPRTGDGHCCEGDDCPEGEALCSAYATAPAEGAVSQCDVVFGQTCTAACGFKALIGNCYCDPACTVFMDCCPNYTEVCGDSDCGNFIPGDLTGDGMINVLDVVSAVNIILSAAGPTPCELLVGDINSDGFINVLDVVELVSSILSGK